MTYPRPVQPTDYPPEQWIDQYNRTQGATLKRSGNEWHGPCPLCGGDDRFWIGPRDGGGTLVGCRGCECKPFGHLLEAMGWGSGRPLRSYPPPKRRAKPQTKRQSWKPCPDPPVGGPVHRGSDDGIPRESTPNQLWEIRDPKGRLFAVHCRWIVDGKKLVRWWGRSRLRGSGSMGGWGLGGLPIAQAPLYLSEHLPKYDQAQRLYVAEGEKAADALRSIGLQAVATVTGASANHAPHVWQTLSKFKDVVFWPDLDADGAGEKHMQAARHILGSGRLLDVAALGLDPSGTDAADWIERETQAEKSAEQMRATLAKTPTTLDRVLIELSNREHEVNDQALDSLTARLNGGERAIYKRGHVLVQVVRSAPNEEDWLQRPTGSPIIRELPPAHLRELLSETCDFYRLNDEGRRRSAGPPDWSVKALLARGTWPAVAKLEAITEGPTLGPDGSILQDPGFSGGVLYVPSTEFQPVPEKPKSRDVKEALSLLWEVVEDFPFETPAHRAAWLSALLTPMARFAFTGPSPLNLIDANVRGAGKSLLADVVATILTGRPAARMRYPRNEEELGKVITALALSGARTVLIDNVTGAFGDGTLDAALTSTIWQGRILGRTEIVALPLHVTWYATGNNIALEGDTQRRCLHIRLQSEHERPERRTAFRHPRLLDWAADNRGRILPAALTLLRAYTEAGCPDQGLSGWGSYEGWSEIVRGCIVWLGEPDPAETRDELETAESDVEVFVRLLTGLEDLFRVAGQRAMTTPNIRNMIEKDPERFQGLRDAFIDLSLRPMMDLPSTKSLGKILSRWRGRWVQNARIEHAGLYKRAILWTVERRRPSQP